MMLSAAVSAGKATIDEAYDIPGVAQNLDLMNLMSYDLHGAWDSYTHHQSGLYAHPDDTGDNVYLNQVSDSPRTYLTSKAQTSNTDSNPTPILQDSQNELSFSTP